MQNNNNITISTTGMKSLKELYKSGRGPSSSHTIGPENACLLFKKMNSDADEFKVTLYGSLAKTGKGHGTDTVILKTFGDIPCHVSFDYGETRIPHPNTMDLFAYKEGCQTDRMRVMSVGGGKIEVYGSDIVDTPDIYPHTSFESISEYCRENTLSIWQYAERFEGKELRSYISLMWTIMKDCISRGLHDEGILPGGLKVVKRAKTLYAREQSNETPEARETRLVCAFAFAVGEQNACGERIVTSPTCGSAGVLPAVLYYQQMAHNFSDEKIIEALETAGIIGNLIKTNASISGAECGCQAEIGSACAMASAALAELYGMSLDKIEYAAEIAMEHHLGLTCDPICGLVQIPCIERNAVAAMRAITAMNLSTFLSDTRKMTLDNVIKVMKSTGHDLSYRYRETSEGGLAKINI